MNDVFKLLKYVKPYWRQAAAALILLTILVLFDLSIPRLLQQIINEGILKQNQAVVIRTSLEMLALSLMSFVIALGNNITSVLASENYGRDLRDGIFTKIQSLSYGNLDQMKTGPLITRLTSDSAAVKQLLQISLRIGTRAPLLMIGSLVLMFITNKTLALYLVPLLLVTLLVILFFIGKMAPLFRSVQQRLDRMNTVLQENIEGVRLVKAFVRANHESQRFEGSNEAYTEHTVKVMRFMATMSPVLTMFINLGMVWVLYYGGKMSIYGNMDLGQIVAFNQYLLTTMTPLIMMTQLSQVWANGIASSKRVNEVLDAVPEVQDIPGAKPLTPEASGRLVFEHVDFHYNGSSDEPVLNDVNVVVEPGQTVAILGATGSGKTSLVNLVPRFYDISSGRITIDGVDIRQLHQESLLEHIGIVPQESVLFSGTVMDNIRYGCPEASEEEVIAAAKTAQAHEFIIGLTDGYKSHVEQRGANFSGGQKQRLAIARALLVKPRILILDDSTSSVDVETETLIQDALEAAQFDHATLAVAQRISTVLKADKIIVMEHGQVVAQGTHKELMEISSIYREIYDSQLGEGKSLVKEAARAGEVTA